MINLLVIRNQGPSLLWQYLIFCYRLQFTCPLTRFTGFSEQQDSKIIQVLLWIQSELHKFYILPCFFRVVFFFLTFVSISYFLKTSFTFLFCGDTVAPSFRFYMFPVSPILPWPKAMTGIYQELNQCFIDLSVPSNVFIFATNYAASSLRVYIHLRKNY